MECKMNSISSSRPRTSYHCTFLLAALAIWKIIICFSSLDILPSSEALSLAATQPRLFAVHVRLEIRPDLRGNFLSVVRHIQAETLVTEAGALQFVVGEDIDTPNTFYLHQQYENKEAYDAHCKKPHLQTWQTFSIGSPYADFCWVENYLAKVPVRAAFCLKVDLFVKPERRDEFLKVIIGNKKGSDEMEPLCLQYVYGEDLDMPNTFHFHEEYCGSDEGKEGFEAHQSSSHFAVWEKFANSDPFTRPPVVQFFKSFNWE